MVFMPREFKLEARRDVWPGYGRDAAGIVASTVSGPHVSRLRIPACISAIYLGDLSHRCTRRSNRWWKRGREGSSWRRPTCTGSGSIRQRMDIRRDIRRDCVELETPDPHVSLFMFGAQEGATLLPHVDRMSTHALSLIINVDQGGMRTPWPLEIYDHAGKKHQVTIEPGELVYYESAHCMHGRPLPLDGHYFVNVFAHYRPKAQPDWFHQAGSYSQAIRDKSPRPRRDIAHLARLVLTRLHLDHISAMIPTPARRRRRSGRSRSSDV